MFLNEGLQLRHRTITAIGITLAGVDDFTLSVNVGAAGVTLTLPAAARPGQIFCICIRRANNTSTGVLTINDAGGRSFADDDGNPLASFTVFTASGRRQVMLQLAEDNTIWLNLSTRS